MKKRRKKIKMHVKTGDTIQIITGSQKGQISTILKVLPKTSQVIIKDLNLKTKHAKTSNEQNSGKIITFEAPIHSSNVMLYSKENKVRSRFNIKYDDNNKKYRFLQKTGEMIK